MLEIGAIVEGKVTGLTAFGAFVSLPDGKSGMVHISEEDIKKRFIDGSKIHGANLRRATLETSWEYQKNKIAEIAIIDAIAIVIFLSLLCVV